MVIYRAHQIPLENDNTPIAILQAGTDLLKARWTDLWHLRALVADVPPEAAYDEDYPRQQAASWAASGSSLGIALMHPGETLHLEAGDWEDLRRLLYVGDDLLLQGEAAEVARVSRRTIRNAIQSGSLFAFRVPELKRRQWRVPRSAVETFRKD